MSFENKKVVITGGTGAVGGVVRDQFLNAGATVYCSYIVDKERDQLPHKAKNAAALHLHKVDLTSEEAVASWFEEIERPDILLNIAGGFAMGSITETPLRDWRHMLDMNLTSAFLTSREALRHMDPDRAGRIINVASYTATQKPCGMAAYTTAKAGVIHLTETLAEETLASKITVNAILPTIMDTPANRQAMPDADFSTWVPPENVAYTICFLAGDNSWHITGACIPLRGHC